MAGRVTVTLTALVMLTASSPAAADSDTRASSAASPYGAAVAQARSPEAIYVSPVSPVNVVRLFDPPPQPWNPGHRGIDLASAVGAPVYAPGDGTVVFADVVVDRGVVTVLHPNGLRSSLEPVEAQAAVGDAVRAGTVLGTVEDVAGHCAPQACVHWGVRDGERYLNPLDWMVDFGPIRLLPLE